MKVLAITQARLGSSRFPEKILKSINKSTLLEIHLRRILKSSKISQLVVATTREIGVESIINVAKKCNVKTYQGSTSNVLDRFYQTALPYSPDWVVRLTSDCPLIDPELIDEVIEFTVSNNLDYGSNCLDEMYPDGQDVEVFKYSALNQAWLQAESKIDKEHVTPYIHRNSSYKGGNIFISNVYPAAENLNHVRMTVDEERDFDVVKILIDELGTDATWRAYSDYYLKKGADKINGSILRNEGYLKSIVKGKNE